MADFKKFGGFAKKQFGGNDKGGFNKFKKPGEEEEEKPEGDLMGMFGKKPGEEEAPAEDKGEEAPESPEMEKSEHETIEAVIDLFDELTPLVAKLRDIKK